MSSILSFSFNFSICLKFFKDIWLFKAFSLISSKTLKTLATVNLDTVSSQIILKIILSIISSFFLFVVLFLVKLFVKSLYAWFNSSNFC